MRVKLTKSVIVNTVSNTEPVRAGGIVEVADDEGRDLVKAGYAEETTGKVTAEAKQAATPENKMAPEGATKETDLSAGTASRGGTSTDGAAARQTNEPQGQGTTAAKTPAKGGKS